MCCYGSQRTLLIYSGMCSFNLLCSIHLSPLFLGVELQKRRKNQWWGLVGVEVNPGPDCTITYENIGRPFHVYQLGDGVTGEAYKRFWNTEHAAVLATHNGLSKDQRNAVVQHRWKLIAQVDDAQSAQRNKDAKLTTAMAAVQQAKHHCNTTHIKCFPFKMVEGNIHIGDQPIANIDKYWLDTLDRLEQKLVACSTEMAQQPIQAAPPPKLQFKQQPTLLQMGLKKRKTNEGDPTSIHAASDSSTTEMSMVPSPHVAMQDTAGLKKRKTNEGDPTSDSSTTDLSMVLSVPDTATSLDMHCLLEQEHQELLQVHSHHPLIPLLRGCIRRFKIASNPPCKPQRLTIPIDKTLSRMSAPAAAHLATIVATLIKEPAIRQADLMKLKTVTNCASGKHVSSSSNFRSFLQKHLDKTCGRYTLPDQSVLWYSKPTSTENLSALLNTVSIYAQHHAIHQHCKKRVRLLPMTMYLQALPSRVGKRILKNITYAFTNNTGLNTDLVKLFGWRASALKRNDSIVAACVLFTEHLTRKDMELDEIDRGKSQKTKQRKQQV